jgi:hypothetical protein
MLRNIMKLFVDMSKLKPTDTFRHGELNRKGLEQGRKVFIRTATGVGLGRVLL